MSQIAKQSISSKISKLDQTVEWFYGEDFTLDQALEKYQSATNLAKEIEQDLSALKNQVEVLADFTK
jgi:exodeoxyribonuclease VII small subunit